MNAFHLKKMEQLIFLTCKADTCASQVCIMCVKQVYVKDVKTASCGHTFHAAECFDLATTSDRGCVECMATRSMTHYQKLFA